MGTFTESEEKPFFRRRLGRGLRKKYVHFANDKTIGEFHTKTEAKRSARDGHAMDPDKTHRVGVLSTKGYIDGMYDHEGNELKYVSLKGGRYGVWEERRMKTFRQWIDEARDWSRYPGNRHGDRDFHRWHAWDRDVKDYVPKTPVVPAGHMHPDHPEKNEYVKGWMSSGHYSPTFAVVRHDDGRHAVVASADNKVGSQIHLKHDQTHRDMGSWTVVHSTKDPKTIPHKERMPVYACK